MFARPKIAKLAFGVAAAIIMSLTFACAPSRADVLGTWRLDHRSGYELLKLNEDGSYHQEVRVRDERGIERTALRTGTWRYLTGKSTGVLLEKCLSPLDITGQVQPEFESKHVNCYLALDRKWPTSDHVQLGSTEGEPYKRVR